MALDMSKLSKVLIKATKGIEKQFRKESETFEYFNLTDRAITARDALSLIDSLVPDKRRLKKWQRKRIARLREVMNEKRVEPPPMVQGKGFKIPATLKMR